MRILTIIAFCLGYLASTAQSPDDIVFSVEDMDIPVSEFRYIYEKNNRDGADYTRPSIDEYLDLYIRFKLKVKLARDLELDTVTSLQKELEGYRNQLAKSFLINKNVNDRLVEEAYGRMKEDLHVSHILFRNDENAGDRMSERAGEYARNTYERIRKGEEFETLARELSQDKSSAEKGGDLGYLTAMLPNGFYEVETVMYDLEPGEISEPVKSAVGYHIIKLNDRRPAWGRVEVSHILARIEDDQTNETAAKSKIDNIYGRLQRGENFEEIAKSVSDDDKTARRGGYIGKIGINRFEPVFEKAAFGIQEEGGYSEPFRTRLGWHIIKLNSRLPVGSFEEERKEIEARLAGNERMEIARQEMISTIQEESGYTVDNEVLDETVLTLTGTFQTFQWKVPEVEQKTMIKFNNGLSKSNIDFYEYMLAQTRTRMRSQGTKTPEQVGRELFDEFAENATIEYAEGELEQKYPEFAALMREYEEGILLFEVTRLNVWDKASQDSSGLEDFFEANAERYMWPERARVVEYSLESADESEWLKAYQWSSKVDPVEWAEKFNKNGHVATFTQKWLEKSKVEEMGYGWSDGWVSEVVYKDNKARFTRVLGIDPPRQKQLSEAKGYVIADYQDFLEKQWVEELRARYDVSINRGVVESLVKNNQ